MEVYLILWRDYHFISKSYTGMVITGPHLQPLTSVYNWLAGFQTVTRQHLDVHVRTENEMEKSAEEYLAKHKILELFENLTSSLVFQRPGKFHFCWYNGRAYTSVNKAGRLCVSVDVKLFWCPMFKLGLSFWTVSRFTSKHSNEIGEDFWITYYDHWYKGRNWTFTHLKPDEFLSKLRFMTMLT